MQIDLKMPDLGTTESAIKIIRWLVKIGEPVTRGQPMLEVETDKAVMEVEAYTAGMLCAILAQPGDAVEAGQPIARLRVESADGGGSETTHKPAAAPVLSVVAPAPAATAATAPKKGGLFARNRQAAGMPAPASQAAAGPGQVPQPLSLAARTAARRLLVSKQTIPHFYLQTSVNAERMIARRAAALPARLAWEAFFVWAVTRALTAFPKLACRFEDEQLLPQETKTIGVAVDLDGDLYIVPISAAAGTTVEQVSDHIRLAVERLRQNAPEARRISRNLMTITNLGMTGVEAFAAIINPPEAAILAVGKVAPTTVVLDGRIAIQSRATLTLSVDHRVANGRYAAEFLKKVCAELESV